MKTYADKTQDNRSRSVANAVSQKQNSGESVLQFLDNRPEAFSQRKLQDMMNSSPRVLQLKAIQDMANKCTQAKPTSQSQTMSITDSSHSPVQRQVPTGGEHTQPVAEAGSYRARGGNNVLFNSEAHQRGNFQFGSKTRYEVFESYNPQRVGNRIVSVLASNGEQMNVEAVQLDHRTSWDTISNAMHAHNQQQNPGWQYSFWDAKMYYNDQPNLHPAPANLNAAAGAQGVEEVERLHYGLESGIGEIQTAWMNLQQTLSGMSPSIGETAVEPIWGRLHAIAQDMNALSENLANAEWSLHT